MLNYLFQYELPDTTIIITKEKLFIITGPKKITLLEELKSSPDFSIPVELVFLKYRKGDDVDAIVKEIKDLFKDFGGDKKLSVGAIEADKQYYTEVNYWNDFLSLDFVNSTDVTHSYADLLVVKDEQELRCVKTAASITNAIIKKVLLPKIETIIDDGSSVEHSKISEDIEDFFLDPKKISKRLNHTVVESAFPTVIQSGGIYDFDSPIISPGTLHFGCIVIQVGARYKTYCSATARTYLIDPSDIVRKHYSFLYDLHVQLTDLLYPGTKMNHIYNTAVDLINEKYPKLVDFFLKDCGSSTGIELNEEGYIFNSTCEKKLRAGMVVNLRVGFKDLELPENLTKGEEKNRKYSLYLSDTIAITDEKPEVLTTIKKKSSEICYSIEENEEEDEEEESDEEVSRPKTSMADTGDGFRITRSRVEKDDEAKNAEERRKAHQKELAKKQQKEAREKYFASAPATVEDAKTKLKEYIAYKSPAEFPRDSSRGKIHIDREKEAVLLPIYGYLVPFHITTIKSVSKSEEYLRIIFKSPANAQVTDQFVNPLATFVKELTYHVSSIGSLNESFRLVNELKKRVNERESKKSVMETLTVQEALIKSTKPGPRLTNLKIRPTLGGGRKTLGTLEAHKNGFRYITTKRGVVDIIYRNIKHAFFQPSEKIEIVLIHFHLHNAIMIGKKKTNDVQFWTEVVESSHSLGNTSWNDIDEIEDEQRQRMLKNSLNQQFQSFVKKVEEFSGGLIEFDIPYRELGFHGAPFRGNVFLQPTVHCLVHLTESPFFVVTLDEVEIAYFERVQFSLRQFDMVIILKDWNKPTIHISAIPINSLDMIKEWLDSCDIKYYEGVANLNWKKIMQLAKANPKKFWSKGGWDFLENEDDGEEEGEDEDEEEGDFVPSGSESDDFEISDSESKSDNDDDSFEEEEEVSFEEDDEEGMDWDTLEEVAKKDDRKRTREAEDEDPSLRRKKRVHK